MAKRVKVDGYAGVYYREVERAGGSGIEKMYYVVYKKDGKVVEAKAGGQYRDDMTPARASRLRSALIEGREMNRQQKREIAEAAKLAEAGRYTISKLWDAYKAAKPNLKGWEKGTYDSLYNKHIKPVFGEKEPKDILALDVKRVENRLLKTHSPQLTKHVLKQLRILCNFGKRNGLCSGLSFTMEMPRVDNVKTEDLTLEQLGRLLKAIDADEHPHAGAMMKTALCTGMRRGEMFRLKWSDLDFDKGFIHIRDPKGGISTKIPMNEPARQLFTAHRAWMEMRRAGKKPPKWASSHYVFPGCAGGQRTSIAKPANAIKKAAGLPDDFRPLHGLRHVYASMLASSGQVDMYTLQKLLTHKTPTMTQRYAHLRDEALKAASDLAGEILTGIPTETDMKIVNIEDRSKQ